MVSYSCVSLHFLDDIFSDVEYLLISFIFPFYISSSPKCLFRSLVHFVIRFFFFLSSFKDSLHNIL